MHNAGQVSIGTAAERGGLAPIRAGRLFYETDTGLTYIGDEAGAAWLGPIATIRLYESYCCVVDQKAQNTNGGTFTQGAWRTRDVNTEQADPDGIVVIAANQITLAAGTYRCNISAPGYFVQVHKARLRNITAGTTLIVGTSESSWNLGGGRTTHSFIVGRFTVSGSQALEIQHQCGATFAGSGFGSASNFDVEIYTIAEFWKEM